MSRFIWDSIGLMAIERVKARNSKDVIACMTAEEYMNAILTEATMLKEAYKTMGAHAIEEDED